MSKTNITNNAFKESILKFEKLEIKEKTQKKIKGGLIGIEDIAM